MILIIEGMDSCGKTTLISNLRKNYFSNHKLIVHHSSAPPNGVADRNLWEVEHYRELAKTFDDLSKDQGYDIICDRFHLGAMVYGMRYRGLNPYSIFEIDRDIISNIHDVCLVLLTDYPDKILARHDKQSIETTSNEFETTRQEFLNFFNYSRISHKLRINITDNGGFINTYSTVKSFLDNVRGENAKSS
jgi:thymidylate kinase